MTNEEIDIAIAEACGWRLKTKKFDNPKYPLGYCYERDGEVLSGTGFHGWGWHESKETADFHLPRYHSDLNAMFAAEETLTRHQQANMLNELTKIVAVDDSGYAFHANARQRATAFLIVKWKG